MEKMKIYLPFFLISLLLSGCAPLVIGGAAIGTGTGTYLYVNGELQMDYRAPFDKVWEACEKTFADMRAVEVQPYREIGSGTITALIRGERVKFTVKYRAKNLTTVYIRVGVFGDKTASQLLHDKIGDNLGRL